MDALLSISGLLVDGLVGLLLLLLLLAVLLRKRVRKRWAFKATFRDMSERKFGEFHIALSRIAKQESGYSIKATLRMQHDSLGKGQVVDVYLDDTLVIHGKVQKAARLVLRRKAVIDSVSEPRDGQVCRVVWDGIEQFRAPILPD